MRKASNVPTTMLTLEFPNGPTTIDDPAAALSYRGSLPGAYSYDRAAMQLRSAQIDGASAWSLLPLALPAAWLVNAQATSRTFALWLERSEEAWQELFALLPFEAALYDLEGIEKDGVLDALGELLHVEGATLGTITKVLGLLRPQLVPMFHDAVVHGILGGPAPVRADSETRDLETFFPLLEATRLALVANDIVLVDLARGYTRAALDAPQVLDRLLWWTFAGRTHDPRMRANASR